MSNNNRGKFMRVSVDLLNVIDYSKQYEMQLILTLLYQGQALYEAWNDTLIETTPSLLIKAFKKQDIPRGQDKNIVKALCSIRDKGIVNFNGDINFKHEITIDVKPLIELANSGSMYVELLVEDFYAIMQSDNIITVDGKQLEAKHGYESLLLQAFITPKARWNFDTIDMLAKVDDFNYAINSDKDVQQAKGVFCCDTLDFIRTHKHYSLDEIDNWCDDRYLMAYLNKLQELGCIRIYTRKMKSNEGNWVTRNFYYIPTMSFECIDAMARQYARRHNYAIKQEEEPTPTVKTGGSFVQARRERKASEVF